MGEIAVFTGSSTKVAAASYYLAHGNPWPMIGALASYANGTGAPQYRGQLTAWTR